MKRIKSTFSIKNLENISGIKSHTIRIWEKRYDLLQPERTDTNIRRYSLSSLQKLLNVTLLYNHGLKISKIAKLDEAEIPMLVREISLKSTSEQVSINAFKLSMVNFDSVLFDVTYDEILSRTDFHYAFTRIFLPLMSELGILWQTGAISPSHEHFITNLVKQKIHVQTEILQRKQDPKDNKNIFALFLPENEIHELAILYLNYYILTQGYKTIFLGQSITTDSLETILTYSTQMKFVTYLTVEPNQDEIDDYFKKFHDLILENSDAELAILGPQQVQLNMSKLSPQIKTFRTMDAFVEAYFRARVFV